MDGSIKYLLRTYNAILEFGDDLEEDGFVCKLPDGRYVVIVKSNLSDEQIKQVILHELGHVRCDDGVPGSYADYRVPHSKMEHQANIFMLRELLHQYILTNNADPEDINCVAFLESEQLPLSLEDSVKQILSDGVTS